MPRTRRAGTKSGTARTRSVPPFADRAEKDWSERVGRLARDIAAGMDSSALSHAAWQELVVWHVAAQKQQRQAERFKAAVRWHLESCAECRALYRELDQEWGAAALPARLPDKAVFPFSVKQNAAWQKQEPSRLRHAGPRIRFLFNPTFLHQVFAGGSLLVYKGAAAAPEEALVLADTFVLDGQSFDVQVFLIPTAQAERFHLRLHLISSEPLAAPLRVILTLGAARYTSILSAALTEFEDISPPDFTNAPDVPSPNFSLTFEPFDHAAPPVA